MLQLIIIVFFSLLIIICKGHAPTNDIMNIMSSFSKCGANYRMAFVGIRNRRKVCNGGTYSCTSSIFSSSRRSYIPILQTPDNSFNKLFNGSLLSPNRRGPSILREARAQVFGTSRENSTRLASKWPSCALSPAGLVCV